MLVYHIRGFGGWIKETSPAFTAQALVWQMTTVHLTAGTRTTPIRGSRSDQSQSLARQLSARMSLARPAPIARCIIPVPLPGTRTRTTTASAQATRRTERVDARTS